MVRAGRDATQHSAQLLGHNFIENQPSQKELSSSNHPFPVAMLVLGRVHSLRKSEFIFIFARASNSDW